MKIFQIDGFKGLITALFVGICAFAGFVIFPGFAIMNLWNKYMVTLLNFPVLDLFQGTLLWGITVVCYFIIDKKGFAVSFKDAPELTEAELNMIMKNAKVYSSMKKINRTISKNDSFEKSNEKNINKDLSSILSKTKDNTDETIKNLK